MTSSWRLAGGLGSGCTACRPPPALLAELFEMVQRSRIASALEIEIAPPALPAALAEKVLLLRMCKALVAELVEMIETAPPSSAALLEMNALV